MLPVKYKDWDKITLTLMQQAKIHEWWANENHVNLTNMPMQKGVIVCKNAVKYGDQVSDIYEIFEVKEDRITLAHSYHNRIIDTWDLSFKVKYIDGEPNYLIGYDNPSNKKRLQELTEIFISIMHFIYYYKEDSEVIAKKTTPTNIPKTKRKRKSSGVTNIQTVLYSIKDIPKRKEYKPINRQTESWTVRGHIRRYKSGKVIHVKEHTKGKKNSPMKPKDYRIN